MGKLKIILRTIQINVKTKVDADVQIAKYIIKFNRRIAT